MIKINLVSETPSAAPTRRKRREFSLGAKQGDAILLVVLASSLVVVGGRYYLLHSEEKSLQEEERQLRAERDELLPFIQKVQVLEAKRAALLHKIEVINELKQNQRGPVRIMDEVSRALPELVWLTNLNLKGKTLTLTGMAMDENAVANYVSNLYASPFFEEPTLKDMTRAQQNTFRFSLQVTFTYAPADISKTDGDGGA